MTVLNPEKNLFTPPLPTAKCFLRKSAFVFFELTVYGVELPIGVSSIAFLLPEVVHVKCTFACMASCLTCLKGVLVTLCCFLESFLTLQASTGLQLDSTNETDNKQSSRVLNMVKSWSSLGQVS